MGDGQRTATGAKQRGVAAFPGSPSPRFAEIDAPSAAGPGQLLLRTLELGICGTDREILAAQQPLTPPGSDFLILGHECLAEVVESGTGVTGWKTGDLVVPIVRRPKSIAPTPGAPARRVDLLPLGAYTERGIVLEHGYSAPLSLDRPEFLFRIDPALKPVAVLTEPLAVTSKAINEASLLQQGRLGDLWQRQPPRVLVTGLGPIGFAAVLGCLYRGWPTTIYGRDDPQRFRPGLARKLGAQYLFEKDACFEKLDAEAQGYDLILECTGQEEIVVAASAALASCGVIAWLGSARKPEPSTLNVAAMVRNGLLRNNVHVGCVNAAPRDFLDALAQLAGWQARDPASLSAVITARIPPDEALWHFEHRQPDGIKAVVVT